MYSLYAHTVSDRRFPMTTPVPSNSLSRLRQHYRPSRTRVPAWLRRVWLWF